MGTTATHSPGAQLFSQPLYFRHPRRSLPGQPDLPGSTPDTTTTIQMVLAAEKPETPAALEAARNFSELVRQAVEDEDYRLGLDIQAGIGSGANEAFLYGKNEPAVQNYHNWVARFMHQEADVNWAKDSGD